MKLIIRLSAPRFQDIKKILGPQLQCLTAAHVTELMVVFDGYKASNIKKSFFKDVGLILGFKISYYAGEESSFGWQWWEKVKKWLIEGEAVLRYILPQELVISNYEIGLVEDMKKGYLQSFVAPKHNVAVYLFNLSILETPIVMFSNSLEDALRDLVKKQELYSIVTDATWIDFEGKIGDIIIKEMGGIEEHPYKVVNDVLIDETATSGTDCYICPCVVIGPNCVVENYVRLKNCMLMNGVTVKQAAFMKDSIIGSGSVVGQWTHISHVGIGREVKVQVEILLEDVVVLGNCGNVTSYAFNAIVVPLPPPN